MRSIVLQQKDMLNSDEGGSDLFFNSVDCLSPEFRSMEIEYDLWMKEPRSVKERREGFLRVMGLSEYSSSSSISTGETETVMGLEKQKPFSDQISETCSKLSYDSSEHQAYFSGEMDPEANLSRRNGNEDIADLASPSESPDPSACSSEERLTDAEVHEGSLRDSPSKKKLRNWWKHFASASALKNPTADAKMTRRSKVKQKKKKLKELTGLYMGQEIKAHKGLIWTMKFSPDRQYLASGGEDGVVRVWRVSSMDSSGKSSTAARKFLRDVNDEVVGSMKRRSTLAPVVLPKKVVHIEEAPIQEFCGHSGGILDLAWSESNVSQIRSSVVSSSSSSSSIPHL